jgi:hypothetical protein
MNEELFLVGKTAFGHFLESNFRKQGDDRQQEKNEERRVGTLKPAL